MAALSDFSLFDQSISDDRVAALFTDYPSSPLSPSSPYPLTISPIPSSPLSASCPSSPHISPHPQNRRTLWNQLAVNDDPLHAYKELSIEEDNDRYSQNINNYHNNYHYNNDSSNDGDSEGSDDERHRSIFRINDDMKSTASIHRNSAYPVLSIPAPPAPMPLAFSKSISTELNAQIHQNEDDHHMRFRRPYIINSIVPGQYPSHPFIAPPSSFPPLPAYHHNNHQQNTNNFQIPNPSNNRRMASNDDDDDEKKLLEVLHKPTINNPTMNNSSYNGFSQPLPPAPSSLVFSSSLFPSNSSFITPPPLSTANSNSASSQTKSTQNSKPKKRSSESSDRIDHSEDDSDNEEQSDQESSDDEDDNDNENDDDEEVSEEDSKTASESAARRWITRTFFNTRVMREVEVKRARGTITEQRKIKRREAARKCPRCDDFSSFIRHVIKTPSNPGGIDLSLIPHTCRAYSTSSSSASSYEPSLPSSHRIPIRQNVQRPPQNGDVLCELSVNLPLPTGERRFALHALYHTASFMRRLNGSDQTKSRISYYAKYLTFCFNDGEEYVLWLEDNDGKIVESSWSVEQEFVLSSNNSGLESAFRSVIAFNWSHSKQKPIIHFSRVPSSSSSLSSSSMISSCSGEFLLLDVKLEKKKKFIQKKLEEGGKSHTPIMIKKSRKNNHNSTDKKQKKKKSKKRRRKEEKNNDDEQIPIAESLTHNSSIMSS